MRRPSKNQEFTFIPFVLVLWGQDEIDQTHEPTTPKQNRGHERNSSESRRHNEAQDPEIDPTEKRTPSPTSNQEQGSSKFLKSHQSDTGHVQWKVWSGNLQLRAAKNLMIWKKCWRSQSERKRQNSILTANHDVFSSPNHGIWEPAWCLVFSERHWGWSFI